MPDTLIVLIGPTGVGKTELSLSIAEHFRTSIVSADSRQLYADLKIGTAAPTPKQLARVPHYFVGTLQLTDYYSAAQYEADVLAQLEILYQNHDTVILTGGSMMYIDAICKGIDDIPTVDNETRQLMLHRYEQKGLDTLCAELKLLDPEYYKIVDLKNPKRVIHALEKANEVDSAIEIVKEKRLRGIIFLGGNFTHPHEKMAQIPVPYVISTIGAVSDGGKPCLRIPGRYQESGLSYGIRGRFVF